MAREHCPKRRVALGAGCRARSSCVSSVCSRLPLASTPSPAQVPARVAPPYTLMDDESRLYFQFGAETPLEGNGPFTGYGYLFYTRPHFLVEDLYLRLVIPPGYLISELILDRWPSQHSALGVGVSGGLWAVRRLSSRTSASRKRSRSPVTRPGRHSAYYLRGPKIGGLRPLEGQIRANPK